MEWAIGHEVINNARLDTSRAFALVGENTRVTVTTPYGTANAMRFKSN